MDTPTQCLYIIMTGDDAGLLSRVREPCPGTMVEYLATCGKMKVIIKLCYENEKRSHAHCVAPQGGIILFDETANLKQQEFATTCYDKLTREYGNIPIVWCGKDEHAPVFWNQPYFEISPENNLNLEAPLLYLARRLTRNDELAFVKPPLPPPPPTLAPPHIQNNMTPPHYGLESATAAAQSFPPVENDNGCCSACLKRLVECLRACYYTVSIVDTFMNCEGASCLEC